MTREVKSDAVPSWPAVAALLAAGGSAVQMRMIDGALAAPDDEPPEGWRELRVALAGEMVTARRVPGGVQVVAWGNANLTQLRAWNALAWAFAKAGGGTVDGAEADEFAAGAEMPKA